MGKREKRLERGVESMKEQIILHQEKKAIAESEGKEELARYLGTEIEGMIARVKDRLGKIHRKDKDYKEESGNPNKEDKSKDENKKGDKQ